MLEFTLAAEFILRISKVFDLPEPVPQTLTALLNAVDERVVYRFIITNLLLLLVACSARSLQLMLDPLQLIQILRSILESRG